MAFKAGSAWLATLSGVQPSLRCTERTGRGWLIRKISLLRTAKIWPLAYEDSSLARHTASGAILAGVICLMRSTRAFSASVSVGVLPIMRHQAKGAMQLLRTLNFCMSSAMDLDSAAMPSLAAE